MLQHSIDDEDRSDSSSEMESEEEKAEDLIVMNIEDDIPQVGNRERARRGVRARRNKQLCSTGYRVTCRSWRSDSQISRHMGGGQST